MSKYWAKSLGGIAIVTAMLLFGISNPVVAETPSSSDEQTPQLEVETDPSGSDEPDENDSGDQAQSPDVGESDLPVDPVERSAEEEVVPDAQNSSVGPRLLAQGRASAAGGAAGSSWTERPITRLAGDDRYETAVKISQRAYPSGADTVLVVTGLDYPDALSAAALGAKINAPLLLSKPGSVPANSIAEIRRLKPKKIVLIGGTGVLTKSVETQLRGLGATVSRIAGDNRYETSVAIARSGWTSSSAAFIATGLGFADALTASAAAGKLGIPVILVPGTNNSAPAPITQGLKNLKVSKLYIAGGIGAVSTSMQRSISSGRSVTRFAGDSRYDTSARIVEGVFKGPSATYWATGSDFADALTGAAVAGAQGAPLLLTDPSCVPTAIYRANDRVSNGNTYLLGGDGVLANEVLLGNECMQRPSGSSAADWKATQRVYTALNQARMKAGVAALRLADDKYGMPAYAWSKSVGNGKARTNPNLATQHPWSVYQTMAQTTTSGNKADRLAKLLLSDSESRSWLLKPNGGIRATVSVGFYTSGSKGNLSIILGTDVK